MAQQIKMSLIETDKPWDRALICGKQGTQHTQKVDVDIENNDETNKMNKF